MRQTLSRGMVAAAAATSILSLYGGAPALADTHAGGATKDSPGVLSGNNVAVPVDVPVNACGDSVDVVAALNPTFGNSCAHDSGSGKHRSHEMSYDDYGYGDDDDSDVTGYGDHGYGDHGYGDHGYGDHGGGGGGYGDHTPPAVSTRPQVVSTRRPAAGTPLRVAVKARLPVVGTPRLRAVVSRRLRVVGTPRLLAVVSRRLPVEVTPRLPAVVSRRLRVVGTPRLLAVVRARLPVEVTPRLPAVVSRRLPAAGTARPPVAERPHLRSCRTPAVTEGLCSPRRVPVPR
ncbi:chaplin [Streptomyces sp. CA-249302]|uniref:chaplin n=1 Tax=Streptomyces sp. CA-249302 TaxID=3240058 RepID=UPI003D9262FF